MLIQVDDDINLLRESRFNDSDDSQEGGGSDSSSNSSTDGNTPSTAQHSNNNNSESDKQVYSSLATPPNIWVQNSQGDQTLIARRLSKDESTSSSNSESPQSGDEYHVYFYNSKDVSSVNYSAQNISPKIDDTEDKTTVFSSLRKCDDPWDVLFARAEGLHAHGHSREACILGVKLAEELLMNPPDLMIEIPPLPKRKGKF